MQICLTSLVDRADEALSYLKLVEPSARLMPALRADHNAAEVVAAIDEYLAIYGHQGYSMDFIEPTQLEDPAALFATLKSMVRDKDYDPKNQAERTAAIRKQKHAEIAELLSGLEYWQFRFRVWLALNITISAKRLHLVWVHLVDLTPDGF